MVEASDTSLRTGVAGPPVPFASHVGVTITRMDARSATAGIPEREELTNHVGSQHAGALFTLAETASGAAMIGALPDVMAKAMPLVRQSTIRYLSVAKGPIVAAASLAREAGDVRSEFEVDGRSDVDVEVTLTDQTGNDVAEMTVEWALRSRKR